jgi:hypothetical protein
MNYQVLVYKYDRISFFQGKFRRIELHRTDNNRMYHRHRLFGFRCTTAEERKQQVRTQEEFERRNPGFQISNFFESSQHAQDGHKMPEGPFVIKILIPHSEIRE